MPYNPKKLNEGEVIKLDMHPHWWYFAEAAATLAGFIVLGILFLMWSPDGTLRDVISWVLIIGIVVGALWVLVRYLKWTTTNFVVTSNRLIFRQGLIAKSGIEIPLERVNNVNFNQGVVERLLGAGDLLIESGGETGQQRFSDIRRPDDVSNLISREMEAYNQRQGRPIVGDGGPVATDVTVQLERLEGLLQRGAITQEEFDHQKARILGI